jgi:regulator of protease activity HflC (stomatin/prohibitin superfamily)
MQEFLILLAVCVLLAAVFLLKTSDITTVFDYEKGLKYANGSFSGIVGAGRYRSYGNRISIVKNDMRVLPLLITGQEMPTKDNVGVRISLAGHYQILDLKKAIHDTSNYTHDLHMALQLAVRDIVADMTLDQLMAARKTIDAEISKRASDKISGLGLDLKDIAIRDIMLPASLKKSMSGVIEAQKDTLRNLEKVRGEHAVLRSLANAANLYKDNPALLNARLIQTLEHGGNTIVFGAEGMKVDVKKPEQRSKPARAKSA